MKQDFTDNFSNNSINNNNNNNNKGIYLQIMFLLNDFKLFHWVIYSVFTKYIPGEELTSLNLYLSWWFPKNCQLKDMGC